MSTETSLSQLHNLINPKTNNNDGTTSISELIKHVEQRGSFRTITEQSLEREIQEQAIYKVQDGSSKRDRTLEDQDDIAEVHEPDAKERTKQLFEAKNQMATQLA